MSIKVKSSGLATTIQDLGRQGYYHLGNPISGEMDWLALRAANLLVGNDECAACLEAVFTGPELEFTRDATVSVTGGELLPLVDGQQRETWTSFTVKSGQVLSFDYIRKEPTRILRFPVELTHHSHWEAGQHTQLAHWAALTAVE